MNTILLVAAAGTLVAQADVHIPLCDAEVCPEGWGTPVKSDEVEGTLEYPQRWTAADVHRALESASPRARCIVRVEVGGVGWNPYAVGSAGELGAGQLHPRGLLPQFQRETGGDPFNPYVVIPWIDQMLARGYGSHWAGVRLGRC